MAAAHLGSASTSYRTTGLPPSYSGGRQARVMEECVAATAAGGASDSGGVAAVRASHSGLHCPRPSAFSARTLNR